MGFYADIFCVSSCNSKINVRTIFHQILVVTYIPYERHHKPLSIHSYGMVFKGMVVNKAFEMVTRKALKNDLLYCPVKRTPKI